MPIKSGSSHGLAVLICTVIAAFLVELLRPVLPKVISLASQAAEWLIRTLDIPIQRQALAIVLVASTLAFIWGIVFKLRNAR